MDKILGLDAGTNSLGWSIIEYDEKKNPQKLLDCGVRIFTEVTEDKTKIPKNQKRREARGHRRILQRKAKRIKRLARFLQENQILPTAQAEKDKIYQLDPYQLRAEGLTRKLTLPELARVFLHLCKRRGFLSNRKTTFLEIFKDPKIKEELSKVIEQEKHKQAENELKKIEKNKKNTSDEKDEKKTLARIISLETDIKKESSKTLGEYLYEYEKEKKRGLNTSREMYENEFELLWNNQQKHHQQILNDKLKKEIHKFIFFQNPLKVQKFLIGNCTFEPNKKRCFKARLEYQEFQIWQNLHNIRFYDPSKKDLRGLTKEEQKMIFEQLSKSKTMSWKAFRKKLNLTDNQPITLEESIKELKGNQTYCDMNTHFTEFWNNKTKKEQSEFIDDILSIHKEKTLYLRLKDDWGFTPEQAFKIITLDFHGKGYANLSLKAINKILPLMREGKDYYNACEEAKYQREDQKKIQAEDTLPYLPDATPRFDKKTGKKEKRYSGPRNPVVTKALNEIRKVVNAIIEKHGKPDLIRLEMARDLKNSKKKKLEINSRNKKQEAARKNAKERIQEHFKNQREITRDDITKYLLWEECDKQCIYTGKIISLEDLFNNRFDVEHTIPFSRSLDDSFINKTLCEASENRAFKKNQTPHEAYSGNSEKWEAIQQRLNKLIREHKLSKNKYDRFFLKGDALKKFTDNFSTRHLNDTRYIATESKKYLQKLGCEVQVTPGTLTAFLRAGWGLNKILKEDSEENNDFRTQENTEKQTEVSPVLQAYAENTETEKPKPEDNKKERKDHRHHTIDAIVVALTSLRLVQRISTLSAKNQKNRLTLKENEKIVQPYKNFKTEIEQKIAEIIVSHAGTQDDWTKGALHEETAYGKVQTKEGEQYTRRVHLKDLELTQIKKIADPKVKELVEERLYQYDNKTKEAFAQELPHKNGNPIHSVRLLENPSNLIGISKGHPEKKIYKYYEAGGNHHLCIFENLETGKKVEQLTTKFEAAQRKTKGKSIIQKEMKNCKFLMSLKINDMLSLEGVDSSGKDISGYYRVQMLSKGIIVLRQHTRSETGNTGEERKSLIQTGFNTIFKYNPQKISIDPIGQIKKETNF